MISGRSGGQKSHPLTGHARILSSVLSIVPCVVNDDLGGVSLVGRVGSSGNWRVG